MIYKVYLYQKSIQTTTNLNNTYLKFVMNIKKNTIFLVLYNPFFFGYFD